MSTLRIIDASVNNLKNFSVELPLKKLVSITGASGSGKTTLLRDILFGEWNRRINSDATNSAQLIKGLPPVFYFGNQRPPRSKESVLEGFGANSLLLELGLRVGESRCIVCQNAIQYELLENLYLRLSNLINSTVVVGIGITQDEINKSESEPRIIADNKVLRFEEFSQNDETKDLILAIDAITITESSKARLLELLKHGAELSDSKVFILLNNALETIYLVPTCSVCKSQQRAITRSFIESEGYHSPEFLNLLLGRSNIFSLLSLPLDELLKELKIIGELRGIEKEVLNSLQLFIDCACQLGLGYLSLDRRLRTLSSGEFQRVKLCRVLSEQVYGSLIALDEPSSGLSPSDTKELAALLLKITSGGNSVFVATHNHELIQTSDEVVKLSKTPNSNQIDFQGASKTYLLNYARPKLSGKRRVPEKFLHLTNVNLNNLQDLTCDVPYAALTCLFGVSGSGKSTLALQVLLPLVSRLIRERSLTAELSFGKITAPEQSIGRVVFFRASRFFSMRRASVVSGLGVVPAIRDIYLKTELARIRGIQARDLNFYSPSLKASEIRFKGVLFNELTELSISEALKLFDKVPALKNKFLCAEALGISYLKLGQPLKELSAGEEQRLNLAARVAVLGSTKTLFILDEPLNGLSDEEQVSVIEFLKGVVSNGHTIVAVEHSPLMLEFADWKIELGPGAGKNGGNVIGNCMELTW